MMPLDPVVGGTVLRIPAIQSPNFSLAGKTGWAIFQDGSAFFFNVTASGTITATTFAGTTFVINAAGAFFYSGTPAAGNLIFSIASAGGIDTFGNAYKAGATSYGTFLGSPTFAELVAGALNLANAGDAAPAQLQGGAGLLTVYSGKENAGDKDITLTLSTNAASGAPAQFASLSAGPGLYQEPDSPLSGSLTSGFHLISGTFVNGWTAAAGRTPPAYRKVASPPNSVDLAGSVVAPAGVASGQVVCSVPLNYAPVTFRAMGARNVTTNASLNFLVNTNGAIQLEGGAVAAGDKIDWFPVTFPLDL